MICPTCKQPDPPLRSKWTRPEWSNGRLFMPALCEDIWTLCCHAFPVQENGEDLTTDQEQALCEQEWRRREEEAIP